MVKNWADHCSSDEEEEEVIQEQVAVTKGQQRTTQQKEAPPGEVPPKEESPPREQKPRVYEYPSEPPFTAYVGNLAYSIVEGDDLAAAVSDLARDVLQADIKVVHARVMKDRHNNDRPRGFGYVEVETVEMLQKLMELNEASQHEATIAGRRVQLDTATGGQKSNRRGSSNRSGSRRGSGFEEIDGSKFRGGRYSGKQQQSESNEAATPPTQRSSLKLKPRSKPLEDGATGGSQSDIFGGAKARDEQSWQERRNSEKKERRNSEKEDQQQQQQQRRKSGQSSRRGSGRGGGRGGRGNGEGRGSFSEGRGHKKPDKKEQPKPQAPPAAPPSEKVAPEPTKKVTNAFSALAMDSDSD